MFSSKSLIVLSLSGTFLVAQTVKRLPTMQETWVQSLGWEDPLEKEMETHSSILAWKIPWTEEPGRLQSVRGVAKSRTQLSDFTWSLGLGHDPLLVFNYFARIVHRVQESVYTLDSTVFYKGYQQRQINSQVRGYTGHSTKHKSSCPSGV